MKTRSIQLRNCGDFLGGRTMESLSNSDKMLFNSCILGDIQGVTDHCPLPPGGNVNLWDPSGLHGATPLSAAAHEGHTFVASCWQTAAIWWTTFLADLTILEIKLLNVFSFTIFSITNVRVQRHRQSGNLKVSLSDQPTGVGARDNCKSKNSIKPSEDFILWKH